MTLTQIDNAPECHRVRGGFSDDDRCGIFVDRKEAGHGYFVFPLLGTLYGVC